MTTFAQIFTISFIFMMGVSRIRQLCTYYLSDEKPDIDMIVKTITEKYNELQTIKYEHPIQFKFIFYTTMVINVGFISFITWFFGIYIWK